MKAAIFFTGSSPVLILTSYNSLDDPNLIKRLASKGIKKFIAFEVSEELTKKKYGTHFDTVLRDVKQQDDLRVLDYNVHHILMEYSLKELGTPFFHEPD